MVFKKNQIPWNKGIPRKKETREKISKSHLGKKMSEEIRRKISKSLKGKPKKNTINYFKPKSEEHKKNIALALKKRKCPWVTKRNIEHNPSRIGPKNPNWHGGLSFEPYNKFFNNKFKRMIRKRDNYICLKCNIHQEKLKKALAIHHVNYDKKLTISQNCCSLCDKCNSEVNYNRKHWVKFFQSLLSEKYGYQYSRNQEIIMVMKDEKTNKT